MASVLLVDDHAPTRELLTERLQADGHDVDAQETAADAFERFASQRPDIVVVALSLPEGDEGHLARRLTAQRTGVPVVVYDSAHLGTEQGIQSILNLRANAYLPDPTDHAALRDKLATLLAGLRKLAEKHPPAAASVPPVDKGELLQGVLPKVLLSALVVGRTGVLVLLSGGHERVIHLIDGLPVGFSSDARGESLGVWLVEQGEMEPAQYQSVLEAMASDELSLTASLVQLDIVSAENVYERVSNHAREMIIKTFRLREGSYRLYADEERARAVPPLEMSTLEMIREGARRQYPSKFFADALQHRMECYPYRSEIFSARLNQMALTPKEMAFAMKLTGDVTVRQLTDGAGSQLKDVLLLLWYFDQLDAIRFSEEPTTSEDDGVYKVVSAIRKKKPLPTELTAALREEALDIVTGSYFAVLGLDISAQLEDVERAYHDLATRFHPDTYAEYDLSDLEDIMQTVLDRITAAYRVLSVEEKRKGYLSYLLSRQETAARIGRIDVSAEIALRRGLNHIAQDQWTEAAIAFQEAISQNPREPEYYCHLAFAQFKNATGPAAERAKEARGLLKKALATSPGLVRAMVLLAIIEQEAGNLSTARRLLLDALKLEPNSVTAKAALHRLNRVPAH